MPVRMILREPALLRYLRQLGLQFLQAHHVRPLALQPLPHLGRAGPDAVDIPGGDFHAWRARRITLVAMPAERAYVPVMPPAAETGFTLARGPDTVRAPDIAFVRRDRLPDPVTQGFPDLAPDLVVEVLSPDDRPGEVLADWLSAGTRLVWTVDLERRVARIYRHDGSETVVTAEGALEGEDVLPGFSCSLVSIL